MILTGHSNDKVLPHSKSLSKLLSPKLKIKKVLDFGCGVGRNTFYFATLYPEVHAFAYRDLRLKGQRKGDRHGACP